MEWTNQVRILQDATATEYGTFSSNDHGLNNSYFKFKHKYNSS